MKIIKYFLIIFLFTAIVNSSLLAQACSCGGVPLLSSLESAAVSKGVWRLGMIYEYNSIADLVTGTEEFDDDTRERIVHSGRLEISYGLNNRISFLALFSILQQERSTNSSIAPGDFLQTRGVGDGIFMIRYNLIPLGLLNNRQLSLGGGLKLPLGSSKLEQQSRLIAADMQPGSGSWDGILWGNYYQNFIKLYQLSVFGTASYRLNGSNQRFSFSDLGYQFGHELSATAGVNFASQSRFEYSAALRYRSTRRDQFDGGAMPNTGGKWLFFVPGLNTKINKQFTARLSSQIPLYRNLNGTQLTTNYTLSVGLYYQPGNL